MSLIHRRIDLYKDTGYLLERHCRINYECDTPWHRKMSYDEYRQEWFSWQCQKDGFLNALTDSMKDGRTIAEIIENEAGEAVAYLWAPFHADEESGFYFADVQDLYVEQGFRKQGIASYLLDYAETKARENGAAVIRSGTGCENMKSVALHEKMGYYQYRYEYEKLLK